MRYFMDLSYKGTGFHGWQVQKNAISVQEMINKALSTILQVPTECVGSGRTDTGVHAHQQIAHFDTQETLDTLEFKYKLNVLLPFDIAVNNLRQVESKAHSRFDASRRTYHYYIHSRKDPFKTGFSYYYSQELDHDKIIAALKTLEKTRDFQAFSKVKTEVKTFECEIFEISWETSEVGHRFVVSADRFLRGMVRAMVGTLLDIGLAKINLDDLETILKSGNRSMAGRAVPPEGLYLHRVEYPSNIYVD
ncbi:MAG: tRNA pseudouridine(38-40) synthase TruA [Bacteroidota bacterium]